MSKEPLSIVMLLLFYFVFLLFSYPYLYTEKFREVFPPKQLFLIEMKENPDNTDNKITFKEPQKTLLK